MLCSGNSDAGSGDGAFDHAAVSSPVIVTVEPDEVACFYESFFGTDGLPHKSQGSCKPSWPGLTVQSRARRHGIS